MKNFYENGSFLKKELYLQQGLSPIYRFNKIKKKLL